jgi:CBS domain-containing protein
MDAMEVLSLMSRTKNTRLLVTEGERLVGVVTLRDLLAFLSVKLHLEDSEAVDVRYADLGAREGGLSQRA